jgi:CO/xanthine dehydrogenase FAD-binding subunit
VLTYHTPDTLEEVLDLRARYGNDSQVVGGGTIFMNMMNEGVPMPPVVIGLKKAGMGGVTNDNGALTIWATTTMSVLAAFDHSLVNQAASVCGGWAIRNMATVGGNLFAHAPGGDLGVALLALDSSIRISSAEGTRDVSLVDFYRDERAIGETELVTSVNIPDVTTETRFVKFGRKAGLTPSVVTVAISLRRSGDVVERIRIAFGAMGPHPVRAEAAEELLTGHKLTPDLAAEAANAAVGGLDGLTDAVSSAWYRKRMAGLHLRRLLEDLQAGER